MDVKLLALIAEYPELTKKAFNKIRNHDRPCRGVYVSYLVSHGTIHVEFEFDSFSKKLRRAEKVKHEGVSFP